MRRVREAQSGLQLRGLAPFRDRDRLSIRGQGGAADSRLARSASAGLVADDVERRVAGEDASRTGRKPGQPELAAIVGCAGGDDRRRLSSIGGAPDSASISAPATVPSSSEVCPE